MKKNRTPSLAEIAVVNLRKSGRSRVRAMVGAAQVCSLIWAWAKTTRDLGHEPTRHDHAQHWKQTERSVYNELAVFRQAFPGERDPQNLANWLNQVYAEISDAGVMGLPAPDRLVLA